MAEDKVVYVNFSKGRKPTAGGFGGGPRLLFGVFAAVLVVELLAAAVFYPRAITSGFFAPTVIAVAVAATLGARRLIARAQVAHLHRQASRNRDFHDHDDSTSRTLH